MFDKARLAALEALAASGNLSAAEKSELEGLRFMAEHFIIIPVGF